MARQDVRIDLPVGNPDGTVTLCEEIIARNTELGTDSPIKDDFNWPDAVIQAGVVRQMLKDASTADRKAQKLHYSALNIMGLAPGQNLQSPNTLYTNITLIRDVLLSKNNANPEALELWGFTVVVSTTGGKRTVKVELHDDSPENFLKLCADIVEQNTDLGISSQLTGKINMVDFAASTTSAKADFDASAAQHTIAQIKNAQALEKTGYAPGQNSDTPDTGYYFITQVRNLLLVAYHDVPDELMAWGFKVVVGETALGDNKEPDPTPPPVI